MICIKCNKFLWIPTRHMCKPCWDKERKTGVVSAQYHTAILGTPHHVEYTGLYNNIYGKWYSELPLEEKDFEQEIINWELKLFNPSCRRFRRQPTEELIKLENHAREKNTKRVEAFLKSKNISRGEV